MNIKEFSELGSYGQEEVLNTYSIMYWIKRIIGLGLTIVILGLAGCPQYNVWKEGLRGQAELARAEHNRQITINEAMALKEAATFKADAEIERARGIEQANRIIAEGLGGPEGYLRYLFIDALQATSCDTIYIPTEAGLPILEARNKRD